MIFTAARRRWDCSSRDGKEGLQQRAVMDNPLAGGGCVERSDAICVPCVAGSATHVSLCTVSGVLITSCRESYARQATREERVRETIPSFSLFRRSRPLSYLPSMLNPPYATVDRIGMHECTHMRACAHIHAHTHPNQMPLMLLCRRLKRGRQPSDVE